MRQLRWVPPTTCRGTSCRSALVSRKVKVPVGSKEGLAKCLSHVLAYGLDCRKTLVQIHGYVPALPRDMLIKRWTTGLVTSCTAIGLIYYAYYAIYNRLLDSPLAGPLSAFASSTIKLPIYNSMKVMQSGRATSIIEGGMQLATTTGLYKGYTISLVEDMFELDIRNRMYNAFKTADDFKVNVAVGTMSSAVAAAITTPFDNVRLQLCLGGAAQGPVAVVKHLVATGALYRGVHMRIASNVVKNLGFFIVFEWMKQHLE